MYRKQQVIQRISQISRQKSKLDELYVTLQKTLKSYQQSSNSSRSVSQMRQTIMTLTSQISLKIIQRTKQLDSLTYRCQKLTSQSQNMTSQQRNISSLKQYFSDLKHNLSQQKKKGEQFLTQKQRWQLNIDGQHMSEEGMSLLNSSRNARETIEMADGLLANLKSQEGVLVRTRNRMGDVLKNINLAANITMMVRNRSRQDNKLIFWLTIGLVVEILLCLFVIKPFFRAS